MLLGHTSYFVREHVGMLKLVDTYDILDPDTGQRLGLAKEEPPTWAKYLRLIVNKHFLPTAVNVYEQEGLPPVFSIRKSPSFLRSNVTVTDAHGMALGRFQSKAFALRTGFRVLDAHDQQVAELKGDWHGWNFKFLDGAGQVLGTVTKQWAGIGKELFTSADNYLIILSEPMPSRALLLLAAGLSVDLVFKEGG